MTAEHRKRSAMDDVVTRECTIHLHKHVPRRVKNKRAPRAIKAIRTFVERQMGTRDVRLDPKLNKAIWGHGIKKAPHRVRVQLSRRRNDQEGAKHRLYTFVTHVPVESFKGLQTVAIDE